MSIYNKDDLCFMYPENWTLSEQAADPLEHSPREVSLVSPDGCMWVLYLFAVDTQPKAILEQMIQGLDQQYEDFEYTEVDLDDIAGHPTVGGDADFYCLDFLVTARIQVIPTPEQVLCILSQAESRDFAKMNQVFLAITTSVLQKTLPTES